MSPYLAFLILSAYFLMLILFAIFTSKGSSNSDFFQAGKHSPWYLVAFGMIGASLSGVTYISIPGYVGQAGWSYFMMVIGYWFGYWVIRKYLLPLYYEQGLVSIYGYLKNRFGQSTYFTGAFFFLLSRSIGSAFRLFLVAIVLQLAVFEPLGLPFELAVICTVFLIWVYTFKGGIKTIVLTDTLQTIAMLVAVILTIYMIGDALQLKGMDLIQHIIDSPKSQIIYTDPLDARFFLKNLVAGMLITIVMTGLDQDMMQKNLTCRTLAESQKNMLWFSWILIVVNLMFLSLGTLLYSYADATGFPIPQKSDDLFPALAFGPLGTAAGIVFLIGVTAAAYSSADSALAALTTSFCVDILAMNQEESRKNRRTRMRVHLGFTLLIALMVIAFKWINDQSVVSAVFTAAGYTYGPLLGLFAFGLFHKTQPSDRRIPLVCLASPFLTWLASHYSPVLLGGYRFGFELVLLNGLITYSGLWLLVIVFGRQISNQNPVS
jgi:Na+/proline symporter